MERNGRTRETYEQAVCRLAAKARAEGVKVYCHDLAGTVEYYATSTSRPGTLHRVTLFSCDCQGFIKHQRCKHHAALLAEVGELPTPPAAPALVVIAPGETPELTTIEIVCGCCGGDATITRADRFGRAWDVTCKTCQGRGRKEIRVAVADLPRYDRWDADRLRGVRCETCHGMGYRAMQTGGRLSDWEAVECRACQGAGLAPLPVPVRLAVIDPSPALDAAA